MSFCFFFFFKTSEHWRREAEDHHRLALQFEAEKLRAIQQRDHALQQIEQMRHFLLHNLLLFPTDNDAMHWVNRRSSHFATANSRRIDEIIVGKKPRRRIETSKRNVFL